jgi:hypothetical protein
VEENTENLLLVCAVIVAGSLFFFAALYFWRAGRGLRERGVTTQATVVKKFRKGKGLENYYALFSFADLQGRPQTVEIKVLSRAWRRLREGGTEAITYLPEQPEKAGLGPKWAKQLLGWVFLLFAVAGGSMAVVGLVLLIQLLTGKLERVNG